MPGGDQLGPEARGEQADGLDDGELGRIGVGVADEAAVELDVLRAQAQDVLEAVVAGAGVLDRHVAAGGADAVERRGEPVVVLDAVLLGELEDELLEAAGRGVEDRADLAADQGAGRDVDGEVGAARQVLARGDAGGDEAGLQRVGHPEALGGREPARRRAAGVVGQAGEHLVALHGGTAQVDDRLEDRPDQSGVGEHRLDGLPLGRRTGGRRRVHTAVIGRDRRKLTRGSGIGRPRATDGRSGAKSGW